MECPQGEMLAAQITLAFLSFVDDELSNSAGREGGGWDIGLSSNVR
jgi:hypothetical protein